MRAPPLTLLFIAIAIAAASCKQDPPPPSPPPPAPPPPAPRLVFPDRPLGPGPCRLISEREVSELVGLPMTYKPLDPGDVACVLRPTPAAGDTTLAAQLAGSGAPEVTVSHTDQKAELEWSLLDLTTATLVPDLADKAAFASSSLGGGSTLALAIEGPHLVRVLLTWPAKPQPDRERATLTLLRAAVDRL